LKILHLNHSDSIGGAAKFAVRLHESLLGNHLESAICCSSLKSIDSKVFRINPNLSNLRSLRQAKIPQFLDSKICRLDISNSYQFKSPGIFGGVNSGWINDSDYDLVHLHWVNGGLISIREIGKIRKPIVWSMLDMWPFTGAEHYVDGNDNRWKTGYANQASALSFRGFDISGFSGRLKERFWHKNIKFIAPSVWLADQARESALLRNFEVEVIPPALNTELFLPEIQSKNLNNERAFTIGYGGALANRKGWQLFQEFLNTKSHQLAQSRVIIFGAPLSSEFDSPNYNVIQMGRIRDERQLVEIYNQLDVLVFPSLVETYGLIAQEAQSCGVPVICLRGTGAAEVIEDEKTGFSIENSVSELIKTLVKLKVNTKLRTNMSDAARSRAVASWSYNIISTSYFKLYKKQISRLENQE